MPGRSASRRVLTGCLALLGASGAAPQMPLGPWSSLEREAQVRTWAHAPGASAPGGERAALLAAVRDGDWTRRAAAFEALRRAVEAGALAAPGALAAADDPAVQRDLPAELGPALRAAVTDPGERALAQALELAAVWPGALDLGAAELAPAAAHPDPAVRLALVRCAERFPAARALLAELARDADARVAFAARCAEVASPFLHPLAHAEAGPVGGLPFELLERAGARFDPAGAGGPLGPALELRLSGTPEVARALAAVWERAVEPGERDALLRAARAARARGLPLDAALRARLPEVRGAERRWLLEGLVASGEPGALVPALDPEDAGFVLGLLVGRAVDWDLGSMRRLVDPRATERELRLRALMTLASTPARERGDAAEQLLALGLADPDPNLVEVAFRALTAGRDPSRWMGPLHAAWLGLDEEERARFLRYLPREVAPEPFRADLLALAADERRAPALRASALELLATWTGDAELARTVDGWLEAELERLRAADPQADGGARRLTELRCTGLVRALHQLGGEAAVPRLLAVLREVADPARARPGEAGLDVAKAAVAALGATPDGRGELERWLAGAARGRARVEAGLQLAPLGSARAVDALAEDYAGCDWELRARALKALQRLDDAVSFAFLARVASAADEALELRELALAGLAMRGRTDAVLDVLCAVFAETDDPELRRSVLGRLGVLGGARARTFLGEQLARVEALPFETRGDGRAERALGEREALLVALGRAGREGGQLSAELLRAWLRLPRAAAAEELEARFVGQKLATTGFRYGAELDLGELLAGAGRSEEALALGGPWWTLDARFLAALGERLEAGGDLAGARAVWRAALAGLAGEADAPDRPALELGLRRRLMTHAEGLGDWEQLAWLCAQVLRDWRLLRTPAQAFAAEFGEFDPERGLDPERRLECALLQARARAALARGDLRAARGHAAQAALGPGFSQAARAAQERLERDLAAAERGR